MITITSNPQTFLHNPVPPAIGQFDLLQVPDLSSDRHILPSGPMPPIIGSSISFRDAFARYFEEVITVKRAEKGQNFVTSLARSCILPALGDRVLSTIRRSDIRELTKTIGTTRPKPYMGRTEGRTGRANSTHWLLRAFFGWASDDLGGDLLDTNPMVGLKQPYRDGERDRVLNEDEIRAFWRATSLEPFPYGVIARLLLLTGQRRGEIGNLRQWQINRSERLLTIPVNKSRKPHVAPLSALALELLDHVPQSDPRALVFPDRQGRTLYSSYYRSANQRIDKRMLQFMREDLERSGRDPGAAYVGHWVFHDLRRTIASKLCERGHAVETIDRLLNHGHAGGGIGRTINWTTRLYCRYEALPERRAAVEDFGKYIRELVAP